MAAQLSYSQNMPVGYEGLEADTAMVSDIETRYNPQAAVSPGRVVTRGDDVDTVIHPADADDVTDVLKVRGIVVHSSEVEGGVFPVKSVLGVMRKGRIWVRSVAAVTEGTSPVHVLTDGTGRLSSDGGSVLPNAKWKTSCGAGELAIVEIDL